MWASSPSVALLLGISCSGGGAILTVGPSSSTPSQALQAYLGADVTDHLDFCRDIIELLTGLFADTAQFNSASTPFLGLRDIVQDLDAGQILRQRFAATLFAGVLRDGDVVIGKDGLCGFVGFEQLELVGIDGRQKLHFCDRTARSSADVPFLADGRFAAAEKR